mmetsp:Transcript_8927/g.15501  ORF Transcript_8927/g.15501 Transcript_8927/m.15501 type:complete len:391 (-) Transcript_8927:117-1289(-)
MKGLCCSGGSSAVQRNASLHRKLLSFAFFVIFNLSHMQLNLYSFSNTHGEMQQQQQQPPTYKYNFDQELARRRLLDPINETHPLPHFLMHIPKTAGYYAYELLMKLLFNSPEMKALKQEEKFKICNIGDGRIKRRPLYHKDTKCTMWMSETPYLHDALNSYALIRDPRQHILSQYFHCAESSDHSRRSQMPPLEQWLEIWATAIKNEPRATANKVAFGCNYGPDNMQNYYTGFDYATDDTPWTDAGKIQELQNRFTVIGPVEDIDRVLCVMVIYYAKWIPGQCVCNDPSENIEKYYRVDKKKDFAHGVQRHGHSHNTTIYEDHLIRQLAEADFGLYDVVKEIFRRQLDVVEREFKITLCSGIRQDGRWKFQKNWAPLRKIERENSPALFW